MDREKDQIRRAANLIRRAMPSEQAIAIAACEHGFGISWEKAPEKFRKVLCDMTQHGLYSASSLMARDAEVLQQVNAAIKTGNGNAQGNLRDS